MRERERERERVRAQTEKVATGGERIPSAGALIPLASRSHYVVKFAVVASSRLSDLALHLYLQLFGLVLQDVT